MTAQAQEKNLIIKVNGSEDMPPVNVDARMVRQALINILSNAIKHSDQGNTIEFGLGKLANGDIQIAIQDEGSGIPEEKLAHVLQPFGQVEDAFCRQGQGGTGLGLPIAKGLIELHGGAFTIRSEVGVGTLILMTLPEWRVLEDGKASSQKKNKVFLNSIPSSKHNYNSGIIA
jgi:two-component system cell cycle sensor histidine kinase PleC